MIYENNILLLNLRDIKCMLLDRYGVKTVIRLFEVYVCR